MRKLFAIPLAGAVLMGCAAAAFFYWPASLEPVAASPLQPTGAALVAKGRYLATAADCIACHTVPGGKAFAGGRPFELPFGTMYSPNITPDPETGLGEWSDAEFVRALHDGVGRHGEDLYPAFPYTSYALLSTDDALAIKAYLATLAPVRAVTPENSLIFPFNQRPLMRAWKLLFVPGEPLEPDPTRDAVWNRGVYLARALAHCGECHTPRNLMFATKSDEEFAGAPVDGWKAYNITSDKLAGVGSWTDDELKSYLSTGHAENRGGATGGMAEAIDLSLRHLTGDDISALVSYLRSVPARPSALGDAVVSDAPAVAASGAWSPPVAEPDTLGSRIFAGSCASCHGWDGTGQQVANAALKGALTVNDPEGSNIIRAVLQGSKIGSPNGDLFMPSFAAMSDVEIAAVGNYVLGHFGSNKGLISPANVAEAR